MNAQTSKRHPHREEYNSSFFHTLSSVIRKPWKAIERIRLMLEADADPIRSWFYRALEAQNQWTNEGWFDNNYNYYEFGVGWGGTLTSYISALKSFCHDKKRDLYDHHIFGFDSFEGLPAKESSKDGHPMWDKGVFSHTMQEIENKLMNEGFDIERGTLHLIKGFLKNTLTPELRDTLAVNPPSIVTIDLDYYSSAKLALEWLRPLLRTGTLFYFDDIWSFLGNQNYGELAAINEFNNSGDDQLIPYPILGTISTMGKTYSYSRKDWEYKV